MQNERLIKAVCRSLEIIGEAGAKIHRISKQKLHSINKNMSKVLSGNLSDNLYRDSIVYVYDYARKAKAQYYPDEMYGDGANFWYFLKYLNVWDALQPENILLRSYMTSDHPGLIERRYADHAFDAKGKLIGYKHYKDHPVMPVEKWRITWRCLPD